MAKRRRSGPGEGRPPPSTKAKIRLWKMNAPGVQTALKTDRMLKTSGVRVLRLPSESDCQEDECPRWADRLEGGSA